MIKLLKNAFLLLKQNSIFIQPLILFFILVSFIDGFVVNLRHATLPVYIVLISLFLLFIAVNTGWFYICRIGVNDSKIKCEDVQECNYRSYEAFKKYFIGVGENIAGSLVINIFWLICSIVLGYCLYKLCIYKIGSPRAIFELVITLTLSPDSNKAQIIQNFYTPKNVLLIFSWFAVSFCYSHFTAFLFAFFNVIYTTLKGNPFFAIFKTFIFLFKNIFGVLLLFITTLIFSFIIYIILAISSIHVILSALALLLVFLYFNYVVFLVFLYYDEKTKSNCNCGCKLDREV